MIYLDSNVFIYPELVEVANGNIAEFSKGLLKAVVNGKISAATSVLTWDELIWVLKKRFGYEVAMKASAKFLKFPGLKLLKVDEKIIHSAQSIVEKYGVNPRDSIHAACCVENGINRIVSEDVDFDKVTLLTRFSIERFKDF